ncbi:MAG: hypothetical protein ACFCVE_05205 [Phycisphaerae bacterium]
MKRMLTSICVLAACLAWEAPHAVGQNAQGQAAPAAPAAPAPVPQTVPAGFELIEVGGIEALAMPDDVAWVRTTLEQLPAVERPTTMPADLARRAEAVKQQVAQVLARRLALPDAAPLLTDIETNLIPRLQQAAGADLKFRFLVTTRDQLLKTLAGGWEHPRFRYNRILNDFAYDPGFNFDLENPGQTVLVPVLYDAAADAAAKAGQLTEVAQNVRETSVRTLSSQTQLGVLNYFSRLVAAEGFNELGLARDQSWFAVGVSGVLGAQAAAEVTGISQNDLVRALVIEPQNAPIKAQQINLMVVPEDGQLEPRVVPLYLQAFRRKAIGVTAGILQQAPENALAEVMTQLRQEKPADGEALLALLEEKTGVTLREQQE